MKRIFKYTFVGLLASGMLLTTSCSDERIETKPTQKMSGQGLLANGNAALVALNGIYREMYTAGWSTSGNTHQCFGITAYNLAAEVMAEDHIMGASGSGKTQEFPASCIRVPTGARETFPESCASSSAPASDTRSSPAAV